MVTAAPYASVMYYPQKGYGNRRFFVAKFDLLRRRLVWKRPTLGEYTVPDEAGGSRSRRPPGG
jgi:hypothetical protein